MLIPGSSDYANSWEQWLCNLLGAVRLCIPPTGKRVNKESQWGDLWLAHWPLCGRCQYSLSGDYAIPDFPTPGVTGTDWVIWFAGWKVYAIAHSMFYIENTDISCWVRYTRCIFNSVGIFILPDSFYIQKCDFLHFLQANHTVKCANLTSEIFPW